MAGKGQLSSVISALKEIGVDKIPIISLAKEEEEIFFPGKSESLRLDRNSAALKLLERIRDESHRFAVTFHRELRKKGQTESLLDRAPGIGEKRRRRLLVAFGSLKKIREATEEELANIPGMNKKTAQELYQFLRKNQ